MIAQSRPRNLSAKYQCCRHAPTNYGSPHSILPIPPYSVQHTEAPAVVAPPGLIDNGSRSSLCNLSRWTMDTKIRPSGRRDGTLQAVLRVAASCRLGWARLGVLASEPARNRFPGEFSSASGSERFQDTSTKHEQQCAFGRVVTTQGGTPTTAPLGSYVRSDYKSYAKWKRPCAVPYIPASHAIKMVPIYHRSGLTAVR